MMTGNEFVIIIEFLSFTLRDWSSIARETHSWKLYTAQVAKVRALYHVSTDICVNDALSNGDSKSKRPRFWAEWHASK